MSFYFAYHGVILSEVEKCWYTVDGKELGDSINIGKSMN